MFPQHPSRSYWRENPLSILTGPAIPYDVPRSGYRAPLESLAPLQGNQTDVIKLLRIARFLRICTVREFYILDIGLGQM
jgi:hypothetical protein